MLQAVRRIAGSSRARVIAAGVMWGVLGVSASYAADLSQYRGLQFGASLSAASKVLGSRIADATVVHRRPSLIQEMVWRPNTSFLSNSANSDPVREGLLCFMNDQLFRIIVTYDPGKIEGLTAEDRIEGVLATYGVASRPKTKVAFHSNYGEEAEVLARWENSEYSYNLVRTGDQTSFAMVLCSKRLDGLAQAAIVEAARLDVIEAPQRELAKQKHEADAEQVVRDKARSANKPNFKP